MHISCSLKKNQNAPRCSEHPPVRGNILLLFLTFSVYWLPTRKKLLYYAVANPARGLLNREKRTKEEVWQRTPSHPSHCSFGEKIKNKKSRDASTGATQVSVGLAYVNLCNASCGSISMVSNIIYLVYRFKHKILPSSGEMTVYNILVR